eukprot:COSAG06_NODE_5644_length_3344_cov_4.852696_3_plen_121_part_00
MHYIYINGAKSAVFSPSITSQVGRTPETPYESFCLPPAAAALASKPLVGMRIGVMREYMDKKKFDIIDHGAEQRHLLSHWLGTNIGKVEKRVAFFADIRNNAATTPEFAAEFLSKPVRDC